MYHLVSLLYIIIIIAISLSTLHMHPYTVSAVSAVHLYCMDQYYYSDHARKKTIATHSQQLVGLDNNKPIFLANPVKK